MDYHWYLKYDPYSIFSKACNLAELLVAVQRYIAYAA